jgi:hypothetical protein
MLKTIYYLPLSVKQQQDNEPVKFYDFVKSHHIDGKVKSSYARRANLEE